MLLAQLIHLDHGLSLVHNEDLIPASRKLFEHDLILVLYLQLLPIVLVVQASLKPMTCTLANLNDLAKAFLSRCPVASLLIDFSHLVQRVQVVLDAVDIERHFRVLWLSYGEF